MAFQISSVPSTGHVDMSVENVKRTIAQVAVRPMNGGNGFHSYTQNSSFQRKAIEAAKELINKSITEKFEIQNFTPSKTYNIADLGCSVGPNTLLAMENIIEAVEEKFHSSGQASNLPDFHVFFSDQASNDFNQLFLSLPPESRYFAAGVPGSFYDRLFPNNSLHFVHSSCASQWLSKIPAAVLDKRSPSWNKGRVHYSNSRAEVAKAFADQFSKDLGNFLELRAHEIVQGGLMALILPGRTNGEPHSKAFLNYAFEQLESALLDMTAEGKIDEEKIDSYNVAQYFASLEEVESSVRRNGLFSIESAVNISHQKAEAEVMSSTLRAGMEGTIREHFGEVISDDLFDLRLTKKFNDSKSLAKSSESVGLFVLLKRI